MGHRARHARDADDDDRRDRAPRVDARATDASERLEAALKAAEECVDDCAVAWDDVEELSAASKDKGQDSMKEVEISAADKAFIESTKKTISAARRRVKSMRRR